MSGAEVVLCRRMLGPDDDWIDGGGLTLEQGRVARVHRSAGAARRAARAATRVRDLGDHVLAPGLVDAHAHLELSALAGELPSGAPFGAWVRELIRLRGARPAADLEAGARSGADRLVERGTTLAGDIDTTGAAERGLARHPLRRVHFREVLDAHDPARTAATLARVVHALPRRARRSEGFAPHAPFTASPALLGAVARLAARRTAAVTIHWSETREELDWLLEGRGPLAALLGASPRASGLDLLERAGLLGPRLSLVHGNHPLRGEPARIARAGATLVHCPGSHAWFGREPFDLARWRAAGVRVALGTDSLASNADLDLAREMALLRRAAPALAPAEVWAMGTRHGAAALGLAGLAGELVRGAHADFVLYAGLARSRAAFLEAATSGAGRVAGVWIGGRPANRRLP